MMATPKTQREHEAELIVGVGSHGVAALALTRNLFRALRAKGVLSDLEIAAIFDATGAEACGGGDLMSETFAESVRQAIRLAGESIVALPPEPKKH
jgi:hypothetical protein